jgi:hypothetical protein
LGNVRNLLESGGTMGEGQEGQGDKGQGDRGQGDRFVVPVLFTYPISERSDENWGYCKLSPCPQPNSLLF